MNGHMADKIQHGTLLERRALATLSQRTRIANRVDCNCATNRGRANWVATTRCHQTMQHVLGRYGMRGSHWSYVCKWLSYNKQLETRACRGGLGWTSSCDAHNKSLNTVVSQKQVLGNAFLEIKISNQGSGSVGLQMRTTNKLHSLGVADPFQKYSTCGSNGPL